MRKLIEQRYTIRQNIVPIIGICLTVYFAYNVGFGTRSYFNLMTLEHQIKTLSAQDVELREDRVALEGRVVRMRPGSLDRDLLEEQARTLLGYSYPGEQIIIQSN